MLHTLKRSTSQTPRRRSGFTLIEILVVVFIIVILVAVVIAVGSQVKSRAQISQTKVTLKSLQGILEQYRLDNNTIPGTDMTTFINTVKAYPPTLKTLAALGPRTYDGTNVYDGFGNAIAYVPALGGGSSAAKAPCFVSGGPDGIVGGSNAADDIYSYDQ